ERPVESLIDHLDRFLDPLADDVDLRDEASEVLRRRPSTLPPAPRVLPPAPLWRPSSAVRGLRRSSGLQIAPPHAQALARDLHPRPVAVEGEDHALRAEAPDASPPARLDRARDLLFGLEGLGDDGLGRGGARRLLNEARGGRLREPRGLGAGALELA